MGCTYCYESSVGFLTSILVFDWLVDNFFKLLLLACFIFAGLELLALPPPALGLLWTFFGSSTGPLRASFGPCFLPLAFLRPLCLLAFSLLDLFFWPSGFLAYFAALVRLLHFECHHPDFAWCPHRMLSQGLSLAGTYRMPHLPCLFVPTRGGR